MDLGHNTTLSIREGRPQYGKSRVKGLTLLKGKGDARSILR